MEYDAQVFKMKANKKARNVWMALSLILSLSYTSDTAKGLHTLPYYAMFMAVCWIPFLFGVVVLRLQGAATQYYKFIVAVGYGVFEAVGGSSYAKWGRRYHDASCLTLRGLRDLIFFPFIIMSTPASFIACWNSATS